MLFTLISIGLGCAVAYGISNVKERKKRRISYWIVGILGFIFVTAISIASAIALGLSPVGAPGASGTFFVIGLGVMAWAIGRSHANSGVEKKPLKLGSSVWVVVGVTAGVAGIFSLGYFSRSIFDTSELPAIETSTLPDNERTVDLGSDGPTDELREVLRSAAISARSFNDRFEAEIWLTNMSRRLARQVKDPGERMEILKLVHFEASRAGLAPELILAVIDIESNFDRYAISVDGAVGLMQIMPYWLNEIGRPDDNLLHTETNLRYGCTILRFYLDKENGDLRRALGRYDGSLGQRGYPNRVIDRLTKKWFKA